MCWHHERNRVDSKLGGVGDPADADPALVVRFVVDPVRDRPTQFRIDEIVDVDPHGFPCGLPLDTTIGVLTNEFLLFVSTLITGSPDHRITGSPDHRITGSPEATTFTRIHATASLLFNGVVYRFARRCDSPAAANDNAGERLL